MILIENIQLALEGLRANKLRALLTMLGIIIGIGSVIGIVTVGDALSGYISVNMQSLGATNVIITVTERQAAGRAGIQAGAGMLSMAESDLISDDMISEYIGAFSDKVDAVSLSTQGGAGQAQDGRLYANVTEVGVNPGYMPANSIKLLEGRFIRDDDVASKRYVAVVSDRLAENMFAVGENTLGREIKISIGGAFQTFSVIGVYKYEQSPIMGFSRAAPRDVRTDMYIPISTCKTLVPSASGYVMATIMGATGIDSEKFVEDTTRFFNRFYQNNPRYRIQSVSMDAITSTVTDMLGTLSTAVAVIAGISLVVGGIGVMNIMLVSVMERTREIGTRKALGARNMAIRIQFIVEAMIICAIGGMLGVALGWLLGAVGTSLMGVQGSPSFISVVTAVVFSMAIGLFFGYYPANKAAKLDPIDALRYE